jgi:SNF2 family DNA or RNA helicase
MCEENGIYAYKASKDAVVDYPSLVNSKNKLFCADTGGNWVLKRDHVSVSEAPWQYMPDAYPRKIVESCQYVVDSDGHLRLIETKMYKRCDGEIDSSILYFSIDKVEDVSEEELVEEIVIHIKSGWIEIASLTVDDTEQYSSIDSRIYANGFISLSESEVDEFTIQRRFSTNCGSEGQSEAGGMQ